MRRASTAERLLAEIAADPDDDAPRQVYADLLVERGDPHGTFIHLQLQRDGLPPTKKELARELGLLTGNARNWVGDLATLFTTDDIGNDLLRLHPTLSVGPTCSGCDVFCRFERGFLVAASLRGTSPVRVRAQLAGVARSPWLATLEELSIDAEHLSRFTRKTLPVLRGLTAWSRELAEVVASPWAPQLRLLYVWSTLDTVERDLEWIATLPALHTLRLDLRDQPRAPAHRPIFERLLAIDHLQRVELPHWHYRGTTAIYRWRGRWKAEANAVSRKLLEGAR